MKKIIKCNFIKGDEQATIFENMISNNCYVKEVSSSTILFKVELLTEEDVRLFVDNILTLKSGVDILTKLIGVIK